MSPLASETACRGILPQGIVYVTVAAIAAARFLFL
jgi:hypothetical protein